MCGIEYSANFLSIIASSLFEAGVDEQLNMQNTGHSTIASVTSYKSAGEKNEVDYLDVLNCAYIVQCQ